MEIQRPRLCERRGRPTSERMSGAGSDAIAKNESSGWHPTVCAPPQAGNVPAASEDPPSNLLLAVSPTKPPILTAHFTAPLHNLSHSIN